MTVITANPIDRGRELSMVGRKIRLVHRQTGQFLHMFGEDTTKDITWAWSGFQYQAEALATRARAEGRDWPFVPAPLDADAPHVDTLDRRRW